MHSNDILDEIMLCIVEINRLDALKKSLHYNIVNNLAHGDDLLLVMKYMHSYNQKIKNNKNKIDELKNQLDSFFFINL
jgi:hypothetical protein